KMEYIDENGKNQTPIMGCYGIGIGRLMASVIEAKHDEHGPIWPVSIAPWKVSITTLGNKTTDGAIKNKATIIYEKMQQDGIEVILDDRDTSAGEKFADIDLLGVPLQFVISQKTLEQDSAEWKIRATGEKGLVKLDEIIPMAKKWLQDENDKLMNMADNVKGLSDNDL
ncbi:MAG: proline--tRNA ligase, partial [Alphaproteobacteria bacterium]|nr:proline--tRNA ligase [Alphaproteobacteria bacterium]